MEVNMDFKSKEKAAVSPENEQNNIFKQNEKELQENTVNKDILSRQAPDPDQILQADVIKTEIKSENEQEEKKPASAKQIREKAKSIHAAVPKSSFKDASKKALSKEEKQAAKKKETDDAKLKIRELHEELVRAEDNALTDGEKRSLTRKKYRTLSPGDIKKRAEMAIKRKKNAAAIEEYEASHGEEPEEDIRIDKKALKAKIKAFKKMRSEPYDMGNDEKFIANLEKNYRLCHDAEMMRRHIEAATEGGYMPEDEDVMALMTKIETYAEVRKYLDAQKNLMKNPYYQYMAKEDITYTDALIKRLLEKEDQPQVLVNYLNDVMTIRSLHFIRRKGMNSAAKHAQEAGKRAAEILKTKNDKRMIVEKLSDTVLNLEEDPVYTEADYDSRFTPELFKASLERFNALKIDDLHFASLKDITDHYEENRYIFRQTHDIGQQLMVAIQRGMAPSDSELIKLRAKIETINLVEKTVTTAQRTAISESDKLVNEQTYEEFTDYIYEDVKRATDKIERTEPPYLGCDLNEYLRALTKEYKQEHKNREKDIRILYGLTHVTHAQKEDDNGNMDEVLEPAVIPADELAKRKRDFQKNLFCSEYMRNMDVYMQDTYSGYLDSIATAHAKKTGRAVLREFGRTLIPYLTGKSAKEVIRVIDILQTGNVEQKDKFWREVLDEALKTNPNERMSSDPKVFFKNAAYQVRIFRILANLAGDTDDIPKNIKDENLKKKAKAFYNTGCSISAFMGSYNEAARSTAVGGLGMENWFQGDLDDIFEIVNQTEEISGNNENMEYVIGGRTYTMPAKKAYLFHSCVKDLFVAKNLTTRNIGQGEFPVEVRDPAWLTRYNDNKEQKLITPLTSGDIRDITQSYNALKDEYEANAGEELKETKARIRKQDDDTDDTMQQKVTVIEGVFKKIMEFDINRFEFTSYKDVYASTKSDPTRAGDCMAIAKLAKESADFIETYKEYRLEDKVRCRLSAIHLDEIQARCDLINMAGVFFDQSYIDLMNSKEATDAGMPFDELLHLAPEVIDRKIAQCKAGGTNAMPKFWNAIKRLSADLGGFDIMVPLSVYESEIRNRCGLLQRSRAEETKNILSGTDCVLKKTKIGDISFSFWSEKTQKAQFAEEFKEKDLTVTEREGKLDNKKSRLHVKYNNMRTLDASAKQVKGSMAAARSGISTQNRIAVGENALVHLSAFMNGKADENNAMAADYADEKKRSSILDKITRDFMSVKVDISIGNDEEFARVSSELELISSKAMAYEQLLKANPEYEKRLMNRTIGNRRSDHDLVMLKLGRMLAISDYYRARKVLLTDPYYVLHYNDEICTDREKGTTDDQKRMAELIDLVAVCTRRLNDMDFRTRQAAGIERVLDTAESHGRQNAYLRGRPDLSKAEPSAVHKANKEIRRYFEATGIGGSLTKESLKTICESDDEIPFPGAKKYQTKAAKNYLDAIKAYNNCKEFDRRKVIPAERMPLHDRLEALILDKSHADISNPTYTDPKTGEVFMLPSTLSRLIIPLCTSYGDNMSDDEIYEMVEGLVLPYRKELDLNNEETRLYVRERFLESLNKMFRIQVENMVRYQNTYGTLGDELPFGVFMESLGDGQKDFIIRNLFGQDMANLCDTGTERKCLSDGKAMTMAELLVKYGKIPEEMKDYAYLMGPEYYQSFNGSQNKYYFNQGVFFPDPDDPQLEVFDLNDIKKMQYLKDHNNIGGPHLSRSEARRIWKKTLDYSDDLVLTGGDEFLEYNRIKLDLLSSSEKRSLREDRKKDADIAGNYSQRLDEREEELIRNTKEMLGAPISDELLRKLIVFHPGMLKWSGESGDKNAEAADIALFIEAVKSYAGIGVEDDRKAEAKKIGSQTFSRLWDKQFTGGIEAKNINELMNGDIDIDNPELQARENPDEIMEGSKLLIGEVRHRMFESIRFLANTQGYGFEFDDETKRYLNRRVKGQLSQDLFRNIMTSDFYLGLGDVGSMSRTYPEKMYQDIQLRIKNMVSDTFDTFGHLDDQDFVDNLAFFGVSTEGLKTLGKALQNEEEKKEEKKVQKKSEPIKEEKKKEEEKVQPVKEEKKEDKKSELPKEEPEEEELNIPLNVINEEKKEVKKSEPPKEDKKKEEKKAEPVKEKKKEEKKVAPAPVPVKLPVPSYKVQNIYAWQYESQDTFNCWACSGAAIFNQFMFVQDKKLNDPVNQFNIRGFCPSEKEMKTLDQIHALGLELDKDLYEEDKRRMLAYMGAGKKEFGNIFEVADFFMQKRTDFALNRMLINLPTTMMGPVGKKAPQPKSKEQKDRDLIQINNQKVAFLNTVNEVLKTGNLVALYIASQQHYVTIYGLDGVNISIMDSAGEEMDKTIPVDDLFRLMKTGERIELTWFSKLKSPAQMVNENPKLLYDEEKKEYYPLEYNMEEALNIAHTRGIMVGRSDAELGENMEGIELAVYVPKHGNVKNG